MKRIWRIGKKYETDESARVGRHAEVIGQHRFRDHRQVVAAPARVREGLHPVGQFSGHDSADARPGFRWFVTPTVRSVRE